MSWKINNIFSFLLISIIISFIIYIQNQYADNNLQGNEDAIDYQRLHDKLKSNLELQKKIPSLGFRNVLADWQYLQFIQYVGDSKARGKTGYSAITSYLDLITTHDPLFLEGILMVSTSNSVYAGRADKSVEFLERVIPYNSPKINPDAFYLWIYKGTDEILFLGEIPSAMNSYEMSAQWALARGDEFGQMMAQRNLETVGFLAKNADSKKAQVGAWANVLFSAFDDETRKMAIEKIEDLGGKVITDNGKVRVKLPEID